MPKKSLLIASILLLGWHSTTFAFKCVPIYGNWCGPNHPAPGFAPPPIDEFDAACMRHDYCVLGTPDDTPCDINFVNEVRATAMKYGSMPKSVQWAEYAIRLKAGGAPWQDVPMPTPFDAMGLMGSIMAPCP